MRTQNNVKRNVCKKISEESLRKKSNNFSINFFSSKDSTKETLKGHSLFKNMKRNLYTKKSFKRQFPAKKSEEKPLRKIVLKRNLFPKMKKHLQQQNCKQSWQETKKIRTGEISGKNALLNFNFHSWQLFLIEISFGWTFWEEILLQILFARGFSDFGWLRSLFRYIWVEC